MTRTDTTALAASAETSKRGMDVLNAAVMGDGVLAKGVEQIPKYAYRELTLVARDRILEMGAVCSGAGVPLKAAAIQLSSRNPNVSSTAIGITRAERIDETLELAWLAIPENVWEELGKLRLPPSEWLY
jgi:D-threo-aldose 1-dehydrogenase